MIRVVIAADVKPEPYSDFSVEVSPAVAELSQAIRGANSELEMSIKNKTSQGLGIGIVDMPSDFIEAKLSGNVLGPSEEVKLKLSLQGQPKEIGLMKSITLELADQDSSRFTVPIRK